MINLTHNRLPRRHKKKLKRLNSGIVPSVFDMQMIQLLKVQKEHYFMGRCGRKQAGIEMIKEIMFLNGSRVALGSDRPPIGQLKGDKLYSFWANNGVECFEPKVIWKVSNIFE